MSARGLTGITYESQAVITDWIMKGLCGAFKTDTASSIHEHAINHHIQKILESDSLSRADDLLLALGKFRHTIVERYGPVREVDFAVHHLNARLGGGQDAIVF